MDKLLILGAGGFGQMVKETAVSLGYGEVVFLDDAAKGADVIGKCCDYAEKHGEFQVAVAAFGNNNTRLYWTDKLLEEGYQVPAIIHPSAVISPSAVLEPGCIVLPQAYVGAGTRLGVGCIVNAGAIVDHDAVLGRGVHVAPGGIVKAGAQVAACIKVDSGEVVRSPWEQG